MEHADAPPQDLTLHASSLSPPPTYLICLERKVAKDVKLGHHTAQVHCSETDI